MRLPCLLELTFVPDFHPDVDFSLFTLHRLTSSVIAVIITGATRGRRLTGAFTVSALYMVVLLMRLGQYFQVWPAALWIALWVSWLLAATVSTLGGWRLALTSSVWGFLCVGMLEHVDACTYLFECVVLLHVSCPTADRVPLASASVLRAKRCRHFCTPLNFSHSLYKFSPIIFYNHLTMSVI